MQICDLYVNAKIKVYLKERFERYCRQSGVKPGEKHIVNRYQILQWLKESFAHINEDVERHDHVSLEDMFEKTGQDFRKEDSDKFTRHLSKFKVEICMVLYYHIKLLF